MAWNLCSPAVPYTAIGDPNLSIADAPRMAEKSTSTSWPSSARITTQWPATASTVPRSSDHRVPAGRVDPLASVLSALLASAGGVGFADGALSIVGVVLRFAGVGLSLGAAAS